MEKEDQQRLLDLPWHIALEDWEQNGVSLLIVRHGDSRHPVIFLERDNIRYAIKETTPRMAEREIRNFQEIERRGIPALSPVGTVTVKMPPIALDTSESYGYINYISGDRGYTVTRLAPRVIPHVLLYRLPLIRQTKQRLLSAVAVLMVELHEHGVYWGDPSLANALIRIDGKHILSIMADAETAEIFPGPVSEGLREQDLAQFGESLSWQAEDLRQAKGLPEDVQVLDESDYDYFCRRYRIVRREHSHVTGRQSLPSFYQDVTQTVSELSESVADRVEQVVKQVSSILPGRYQKRIYQLIHVTIPRRYARRFYHLILGHQEILQKNKGRPVSIEEAAHSWYNHYHLPTILLLRQRLTQGQNLLQSYFSIMRHKWNMSEKAGYEVPLDEAILDWGMHKAKTSNLGTVDPATVATWWHKRKTVENALEPQLIESEELDPLVSTAERPLIHMNLPELEQKLPEIIQNTQQTTKENNKEE